jgi:HEAT repeat protein
MMLRKIFTPLFSALIILFFLSAAADAGRDIASDLAAAQDRTRSVEDRLRAIRTMGQSGDEGYSEPLLRMLKDKGENRRVRTGAVMALAELGRPRPKIIEAYEEVYRDRKTGENLRYSILLALGRMKSTESYQLLADALSNRDSMIRFKAAQALGDFQSEEALNLLAYCLEKEPDRLVRAQIVRSLGRSENAFVEGVLSYSLKTDQAAVVRYNAAVALGNFKALGGEGREALQAAREDSSPMVREAIRGTRP